MQILIFGPRHEYEQVLTLLPAVERTGPGDPAPEIVHVPGTPCAVSGDLVIVTASCLKVFADEARVRLRPGGALMTFGPQLLGTTSHQARAQRFTLSQSCQGDPDTCGCGGACPMLNAAA